VSNYRDPYAGGYRPGGGYRIGAYPAVSSSSGIFVPPLGFTAILGYSASNINGQSNVGFADGLQFSTWTNLGSLGTAGDATQATGGSRPTFIRNVGTQINGRSAVRGAGGQSVATASFTAQVQPLTWFALVKSDLTGSAQVFFGSLTSQEVFIAVGSPGNVQFYAGSTVTSTLTMQANKYHSIMFAENGASSSGSLDGTGTGAISTGAQGISQLTLMADSTPANWLKGDLCELWCYAGAAPTQPQWDASINAYYGITPS